jgi:hypothetical protein
LGREIYRGDTSVGWVLGGTINARYIRWSGRA